MKKAIERLMSGATRLLVLALGLGLATTGWADTPMTNPVTDETESYDNIFMGETAEWNSADNWDTGNTPFISGNYDPALVNGAVTVSTSTAIDGWTLRVGAYNGAAITWSGGITKIQAGTVGCWLTAADTSKITIASFAGNQLEGNDSTPFKLTSANAGGITWSAGLTSASNTTLPFWYYLKGAGTVVYGGDITVANAQVIKQADVTLSGNAKSVQSKTLVSFGSGTTKTFTADAAIKVYGTDGTTLVKTVYLATVNTTGSTTLTTSDSVGTCEIVQTSTGIVLYYVDGDPSAIVAKTYKPSININFTSGTALSTAADVGVGDYAIPGTSWNNLIGNNGTLSTVVETDENGDTATVSGATVTISGTRGYWTRSGLSAASDLRQGYIDDADGNASPTVTVTGIPYYSYKLVVYFSNDTDGRQLGHLTVNGTNYKWDSTEGTIVTCEGAQSDVWGSTDSTAYTEGGNYLVFPTQVNTDGNLTIVGHRWSSTLRAGLAAVQIIEVKPDVGDNDLEIAVDGDTNYTVSEAQNLSGTVYLTGSGTLTLDGSAKISASTIDVGINVTLNINADRLDATTFTGAGTIVYDGSQPDTTKGFDNSAWTGTVWVKNIPVNSKSAWTLADYGNAKSKLRFTDVNLYFASGTTAFPGTVDLDGTGMNVCDGYGGSITTIARLTGSGTLSTGGGSSNGNGLTINDASAFTGTITLTKFKVIIGTSTGTSASGVLQIDSGAVATVASGKTWTAPGGFVVNGTLNDNGTLTSSASAAVTGSGTVVFTGRAPTPTGDAWWKNANWTGTVQMKSVTLVGTSLAFNDYGNTGSVLELNGCSGWLTPPYTCTVPLKITGTLSLTNGYSGKNNAFKVGTLLGDGTISGSSSAPTMVFNVTTDWSGFTGKIALNNKCVVFGSTIPDSLTEGRIYIAEGAQVTVQNTAGAAWWGVGGIQVDGELRANSLDRFGGGTNITTSDNGVFTLTSTGNGAEGETDTDYSRIKGTGSLKYGGTGWRALTTNNLSTAVTLVNEQSGDILLSRALTYTIGSLSGSKKFQGNYGSGSRYLNIVQTKDTEWSGTITTDDKSRLAGFSLDATATGTLTLSGTETQSATLAVNGGSVNLTGTWVGATTVAGTIGGTGTLTGNLTFSDGATFKAFASDDEDDEDGLVVSGTVTCPSEGTVTVDVSALTETTGKVTLMTAANATLDAANFALAIGNSGELVVEDYALKVDFTAYAASYGGVKYPTVQEAIDAAVADGHTYADVTILDATAECPAGYYVDTEDNDALKMYQAAIVKSDESKVYFKTAQLAFDDIAASTNLVTYMQGYVCVEVYYGTDVAISINASATIWAISVPVKIRCLDSATVSVTTTATESTLTAGTADENGIVTYSSTPVATTYVWAGTAGTAANWSSPAKWKVGSAEGDTASRAPGSTDTVVFSDGASVSGVSGISVAALQVSGTVTFTGGGTLTSANAITLGANDSIVITGTLSPVPTTSVADSYVKETGDTTKTYAVDAYNVITVSAPNATVTRTDALETAIKDGDTITFTVEADQGYSVTGVSASSGSVSGDGPYSYVVDGNATITVTTQQDAQITGVVFDYYVGYTNADVRVTVDQAGTYTLMVRGTEYEQTALEAGPITFENVDVTGVTTEGGVSWTITASGGASGTTGGTSPEKSSGTVTDSGWMAWSNGGSNVGSWDPEAGPSYSGDEAAFSGTNTYTAAWMSTGEVVTVTTNVKFGDEADPEMTIDANAQAAVRIGAGNVFQVYAGSTPDWVNVYNDELGSPDGDVQYGVTVKLNYSTQTYGVDITKLTATYPLTNATGGAAFPLAKAASAMQQVSYLGAGSFISLSGQYVSAGYTADVGTEGSATNVVVSSDFVNTYMSDKLASEISDLLAPNATKETKPNAIAANGYNYFTSYALGLDPTDEDDKPTIKVETNSEGKFVVTLVDGNGDPIVGAANVALTLKFQSGTDPNSLTTETISSFSEGSATIDPSTMEGNVKYYKVRIDIGAK